MIFSAIISSFLTIGALENTDSAYGNLTGATGTLRTFSFRPNETEIVSLGLMGSFFSDDPFIDSRKHSQSYLRIHGNYSFGKSLPLEIFSGFAFRFNENSTSASSRTMTTFFENTDLGLRFGYNATSILAFGGYGLVRFFSGTQSLRNASGGLTAKSGPFVSGQAGIGATLHFDKSNPTTPIRWHINAGYRLPNSKITGASEDFNKFSLDTFKYQAIIYSTSVEYISRYLIPFVEYTGEYAIGAQENVSFKDNRQKSTLGVRVTPLRVLNILVAGDYNFQGPSNGATIGIPRNAPWEIWFGINFAADRRRLSNSDGSIKGSALDEESGLPLDNVEVGIVSESINPVKTDMSGYYEFSKIPNGDYEITFTREGYEPKRMRVRVKDGADALLDGRLSKVGPKFGSLTGTIMDKETQQPISRAFVTASGAQGTYSSDETGRIQIPTIQEGEQRIRVEAPGYLPGDFPATITARQTTDQPLYLEKAPPATGTCEGIVKNPEGTPLTAVFTSESGATQPFGTDPITGAFKITLPPGRTSFKVQAENYLPQTVDCDVQPGQKAEINLTLEKPKEAVVVDDKIILPDAIYFEFGSAKIKEDSFGILDQVAQILEKNDKFDLLKIEGHTDDVGSDAYNAKLSKQRAQSVRAFLLKKGLDAKKVQANGFGESKPVATNTTAEGRAENRRVEFNLIRGGETESAPQN